MPRITSIQVRRDLSSNWTTQVLNAGEIGFETDTGKFKIGTGVAWNLTEYATDVSNFVGVLPAGNGGTGLTTGISQLNASNINAGVLDGAYGGTGNTYGSSLIGAAQLNSTVTKADTTTTCEAVFKDSTGATKYINVDKDTSYLIEGVIRFGTAGTSNVPRLSVIYLDSAGSATNTAQAISGVGFTQTTAALLGRVSITAVNTDTTSSGTANAALETYCRFHVILRTDLNQTNGGKLNIGGALSVGQTTTFGLGSYVRIWKIGSGATQQFGDWVS